MEGWVNFLGQAGSAYNPPLCLCSSIRPSTQNISRANSTMYLLFPLESSSGRILASLSRILDVEEFRCLDIVYGGKIGHLGISPLNFEKVLYEFQSVGWWISYEYFFQVWEVGHHPKERSEDKAGARAVDGDGRGAIQERNAESDRVHWTRTVEETQAADIFYASGARTAQRAFRAEYPSVRYVVPLFFFFGSAFCVLRRCYVLRLRSSAHR